MVTVDWNWLSEQGLLYKINKDVLHPLGLAASRNPDTGGSDAILVADDLVWEYSSDLVAENEAKLRNFEENREKILKEVLTDSIKKQNNG